MTADAMIRLLLARKPVRALGTVMVVGAGRGDALDGWLGLAASRLILVEADPEAAQTLRERASGRRGVEVVERAVVPSAAGTIRWSRYNLPELNGPRAWPELASRYPGLRRLDELSMRSEAIADLVHELDEDPGAGRDDVLVMDVPAQEQPLLQAWPAAQFSRWQWLLVRGCSVGPASVAATLAWLTQGGWQGMDAELQAEPLWPVHLLRQGAGHAPQQPAAEVRDHADDMAPSRALDGARQASTSLAVGTPDSRVRELEAELAGARRRLALLEQELLRAEAQIGLLKDLLLREPGL